MSNVTSISGRLSLRPPQQRSLEVLDAVVNALKGTTDPNAALDIVRGLYPSVTDFERDFPSLCFALATGVGKTRLMGAFIAYLYQTHGIQNFFVLAPNLTIYRKLIEDFTPNTKKYVFAGLADFAVTPPEVITGDDYESRGQLLDRLNTVKINIFNIAKIASEVRGGKSPRIKRLSEYIGKSYFEYLAAIPDLVLLMDESHRYRASAGVRAINELKPILGLELTATPFVETARGAIPFKNVVVDYPLAKAMADGFVKSPAVVTRKGFDPKGMNADALEKLKLEDGIRLHEQVKTELYTYATNTGRPFVKPFVLVIARDTTHAGKLVELIESPEFFKGHYAGKVIQVDSSRSGAEEEQMIERLLTVEHPENPTEIVVHVNMLKEGWDVTNLYTIVPLRAANARILIEQSIGRGLRLPYGSRTGVAAVDRLNIIAHDKFQEIVDEASRPDSPIQLQRLVLTGDDLEKPTQTVISESNLELQLGIVPQPTAADSTVPSTPSLFVDPAERRVAQVTYEVLKTLQTKPDLAPTTAYLRRPEVQAHIVREVRAQLAVGQLHLDGTTSEPDVEAIVARTAEAAEAQTIDIPRIMVVPLGEVSGRFVPFTLDLSALRYQPPEEALWVQHLRDKSAEIIGLVGLRAHEPRLEDYVVSGLVDYADVSYDHHSDLLYELAGQVVTHLREYLEDHEAERVLRFYQRQISELVHAQMTEHWQEDPVEFDIQVRRGWTSLKPSAFSLPKSDAIRDFREVPQDKSKIAGTVYGGFERCLYSTQKFQSNSERVLALILDRDSHKWFRPVTGQFLLHYRVKHEVKEYIPDFVAEVEDAIYMLECKASNELSDQDVLAKQQAAIEWCKLASDHAMQYGGKPWRYLIIPHDAIKENRTLTSFV